MEIYLIAGLILSALIGISLGLIGLKKWFAAFVSLVVIFLMVRNYTDLFK